MDRVLCLNMRVICSAVCRCKRGVWAGVGHGDLCRLAFINTTKRNKGYLWQMVLAVAETPQQAP